MLNHHCTITNKYDQGEIRTQVAVLGERSISRIVIVLSLLLAMMIPGNTEAGTEPELEPEEGPSDDGFFNLSLEGQKYGHQDTRSFLHVDEEGNTLILIYCKESGGILFSKIEPDGNYIIRSRNVMDADIFWEYDQEDWFQIFYNGRQDRSFLD